MNALWIVWWIIGLAVSTLLGSYIVKNHRQYGLMALGGMLAIYVVGANILVPRLVDLNLFGMSFILVTCSIIWPYTAQVSDMINEIYGKKAAYLAAALAYVGNLMFVGFVLMSFNVPAIWDSANEAWYTTFFGVAWRVTLASICSYTLANFADINVFAAIKKYFAKREGSAIANLFGASILRSAASDGINMVIDNIVFYTIAFLGTMPFPVLLSIIGSSMLAKVILSQVDLPFYLLFRYLTREVKRDY